MFSDVGAEDLVSTTGKSKNAKKRGKSKAKTCEGVEDDVAAMSINAEPEVVAEAPPKELDPLEAQKRIRNLRKKLTKIEGTKEKQARGEALEPEQLASLASESDLKAELRALGATDV